MSRLEKRLLPDALDHIGETLVEGRERKAVTKLECTVRSCQTRIENQSGSVHQQVTNGVVLSTRRIVAEGRTATHNGFPYEGAAHGERAMSPPRGVWRSVSPLKNVQRETEEAHFVSTNAGAKEKDKKY